jgi:hypothetical protein
VSAAEPLQIEMDHFLECARTGGRPRTDGESGLRVVRVLEAIERSGRNGNRLERIRWNGRGSLRPAAANGSSTNGVHTNGGHADGTHPSVGPNGAPRPAPAGIPAHLIATRGDQT